MCCSTTASKSFGCVWLVGAQIGGRLQCDGAQFLNRSDDGAGQALVGADAHIVGAVCLRDKFKAEGQVSFLGARIGGDIDLTGGSFRNDGGPALIFGNVEIAGQLLGGAKVTGQFAAQGMRVARNFDLRGAEIAHPINGREKFGRAIDAASLNIGGAALLHGANIKGEVFIADARIEGYLAFGGGRFINPGGWAIRAPNARVGGNLTFKIADSGYAPHGQKTVIEGGVKLDRARIDGAVGWLNLELRGPGPDGREGRGAFIRRRQHPRRAASQGAGDAAGRADRSFRRIVRRARGRSQDRLGRGGRAHRSRRLFVWPARKRIERRSLAHAPGLAEARASGRRALLAATVCGAGASVRARGPARGGATRAAGAA